MFFEIINPCNIAQTIFSIEYWCRPWSTKKNWIKKIMPPSRSIHPKATPMTKNGRKLFKNSRLTRSFHWKSKSLIKYQTFRFSMETPSKSYIFDEFSPIFGYRRHRWANWSPRWGDFFDPGLFVLQCLYQNSMEKNVWAMLQGFIISKNISVFFRYRYFPRSLSTYLESVSCLQLVEIPEIWRGFEKKNVGTGMDQPFSVHPAFFWGSVQFRTTNPLPPCC